ncbi:hypothetical protein AOLI_G00108080 [Acnodon oligacanthus]
MSFLRWPENSFLSPNPNFNPDNKVINTGLRSDLNTNAFPDPHFPLPRAAHARWKHCRKRPQGPNAPQLLQNAMTDMG